MSAEIRGRTEIDAPSPEYPGEFLFHFREPKEPYFPSGMEFDEDIDVAGRPEAVAQDRPKEAQAREAVPLTEV